MATKAKEPETLAKLREPFATNHISKLPKETRAQIDARKGTNGRTVMVFNCPVCGGHHHKDAVHLDYVGHAALTDRLLDTDIEWSWEPVGFTPEGLPAFDRNGGLWIKLTVCGVSRYGYGAADGKSGGDAVKEIIGDALRNAAMRFGAALDLWHKGDLHPEDDEPKAANDRNGNGHDQKQAEARNTPFPPGPCRNVTELKDRVRVLWADVEAAGDPDELDILLKDKENVKLIAQLVRALPDWWEGRKGGNSPFEGLEAVISRRQTELAAAAVNAG